MVKPIFVFAVCSGLALGQNDTIKFFWPGAGDYQTPAVAVQSVNASATVFHVACPSPTAEADCDWRAGVDYTIFNSSTYEATMTGSGYALTQTCTDKGQGSLRCYEEGRDDTLKSIYVANRNYENAVTDTITATITSGAEKLHASAVDIISSPGVSPTKGSSASSPSAPATASTAHLPQATGAAASTRGNYAAFLVVVCAGAAAILI